jgi:exonuclease III
MRGLRGKTHKLLSHLNPDFPDVLCFTEHHLNQSKLKQICIENYKLGACYCRLSQEKGGVCIFIHDTL